MTEQRGLPCVLCLGKGHTCYTERMICGHAVCIFCEDKVECPFIQAQKRKAKVEVVEVPKSKTRKKHG